MVPQCANGNRAGGCSGAWLSKTGAEMMQKALDGPRLFPHDELVAGSS